MSDYYFKTFENDGNTENDRVITNKDDFVGVSDVVIESLFMFSGGTDFHTTRDERIEYIMYHGVVKDSILTVARILDKGLGHTTVNELPTLIASMLKSKDIKINKIKELAEKLEHFKSTDFFGKVGATEIFIANVVSTLYNLYYFCGYSKEFVGAAREINTAYENGGVPTADDILSAVEGAGGTINTLIGQFCGLFGPVGEIIGTVVTLLNNHLLFFIDALGEKVKGFASDKAFQIIYNTIDCVPDNSLFDNIDTISLV